MPTLSTPTGKAPTGIAPTAEATTGNPPTERAATGKAATTSAYVTSIADSPEQIHAAQRLRYQVFAKERGARLEPTADGRDVDEFDDVMDHLIVTETTSGAVVGTYRLLPPGRGDRLFSDTEFDLGGLPAEVRSQMVEAGRACVHPDHRSGAVINLMWAGLARYVLLSGHRYLAGCASVPLADGGQAAANAWLLGTTRHAAPRELRVHPLDPWMPARTLTPEPSYAALPPLLRGYLRVGAWMCGSPQHEKDFDDADFFVILDTERLSDRYRRFFLGESR